MNKIATLLLAGLAFGAFGCSDPCGDLKKSVDDCCAKITDATLKAQCSVAQAVADAAKQAGNGDACKQLNSSFKCPQ